MSERNESWSRSRTDDDVSTSAVTSSDECAPMARDVTERPHTGSTLTAVERHIDLVR